MGDITNVVVKGKEMDKGKGKATDKGKIKSTYKGKRQWTGVKEGQGQLARVMEFMTMDNERERVNKANGEGAEWRRGWLGSRISEPYFYILCSD